MADSLRTNRFSALVEHAQDIIIVVDESGCISYVNPAIEELLGYAPEELVGENAFELMHPDDRNEVFDRFKELLDRPGEATDTVQHRLKHTSGDWRWVESVGSNHSDAALDGYVINSRDITERKRREQDAARQRALLEAQQESVLDGLLVVDETGEIVSSNDKFVALWGIPEDLIETGDDEAVLDYMISQVAHPTAVREQVDYLSDHESETARDQIELEDGRVFDRYTTPLTTDEGTYVGRLWTFRDITERIERESELQRQNERLGEFASIVSHDLRNPLNVATGRLELLEDECDSEHLEAVARAHDRIEELIDDLLSLARMGQMVSDLDAVDVAELAETAWQTVETGDTTLAADIERPIRADRSRLRQLLENLVRNAVEHGGADGTVTVGQLPDGFYVEDDGPGIPPEDRDEVFEIGFSTSEEGTGFGLSIVEQVTEAHDWTISVTEGSDGGARFEITGVEFADE